MAQCPSEVLPRTEEGAHHAERDGYITKTKAAGEALPPSKLLTGPASLRRSVCAPRMMRFSVPQANEELSHV